MLTGAILSIREGVEVALLIGIILSALHRINRSDLRPTVWVGVFSAVSSSLVVGLLMSSWGTRVSGPAEAAFEGISMLVAAVLLTWMVFWMSRQSRRLNQVVGNEVEKAARYAGRSALFGLVFLAVFREGVELVVYLNANRLESGAVQTAIGALAGLAAAIFLGWSFFHSTRRINLHRFFQATSILLILFAAGLIAHSAHELIEVGWVPPLIPQVWNLNGIISDQSLIGQTAGALFGYSPTPSLFEILSYATYVLLLSVVFFTQSVHPNKRSEVVDPDA